MNSRSGEPVSAMEKKLFVTDLDGTLFNDGRTISDRDRRTLEELRKKGVATAIATGRSLWSLVRALAHIGMDLESIPVDYLVFATGAGTMALPGRRLLEQHDIPEPEVAQLCAYFSGQEMDFMVHRAIPDTHYFLYKQHGRDNPDFWDRVALYREFATPLDDHGALSGAATEVLAVLPGEPDRSCLEQIKIDLCGFSVIHATSPVDHASLWVEVFHPKVSKGRAVQRLACRLGISREHVIAVGNDYNDQDLLSWAGKGFITANGAGDLLDRFENTASNNDSGVSEAAQLAGL